MQALPQVDEKLWSWGIPGWRQDLIEALLKALPKDKRRNLVPIPDTTRKLIQAIDAVHLREHLFQYLAFALRGEQITEKDFSFERIDQYLIPFIKVVDEKGKPVAGANIYIEGTYDGTSSDEKGDFNFSTTTTGNQILVVSFLIYDTSKIEIQVADFKNKTIKDCENRRFSFGDR